VPRRSVKSGEIPVLSRNCEAGPWGRTSQVT
jgi:hypothetical protein